MIASNHFNHQSINHFNDQSINRSIDQTDTPNADSTKRNAKKHIDEHKGNAIISGP
jgi:hypothetical protein